MPGGDGPGGPRLQGGAIHLDDVTWPCAEGAEAVAHLQEDLADVMLNLVFLLVKGQVQEVLAPPYQLAEGVGIPLV